MRICGACRGPVRWDESLAIVQTEQGGFAQACPRCVARSIGRPPPEPQRYPEGRVPRHPLANDWLPICGLCREALYEGEQTRAMRPGEGHPSPAGGVTGPGAYAACPRCIERYRPIIHRRLIDLGYLPEGSSPEVIGGGNML